MLVCGRAHERPLTKAAPPQSITLEEALRQLQGPAQASVQLLAFWNLDASGQLHDRAAKHVQSGGEEIAAFLKLGIDIMRKSSQDGPVDEVLQWS